MTAETTLWARSATWPTTAVIDRRYSMPFKLRGIPRNQDIQPPDVGCYVRSERSASMMATARATPTAAAAARGPARRRALRDHADASRDHAPHGRAGFGVSRERRIHHRLLDLEAERLLPGFLRDGFVNVGGHRRGKVRVKVKGKGKGRLRSVGKKARRSSQANARFLRPLSP